MSTGTPYVVGIGGTLRPGSSSEKAMAMALAFAQARGARTRMFAGSDLMLPLYNPGPGALAGHAAELVASLRQADGVILSSPCYHGGVSGLIKNAIDYTEEMRDDERVYLDGRAVGAIGCGYGYQGPGVVLSQLRQITHALRGWPVPLGVAVNSGVVKFEGTSCSDPNVARQLEIMAAQVVEFGALMAAKRG
ncbi:MAG TPA: NAD(P)H-dependent oxidoreductase [Beijerinckiaceae bacterium]|nr:NAD(P)H-dependent oxidoreductase [Beijerinckiaceae bacterium]